MHAKLVELSEDLGPEIAARFTTLLNEEAERVPVIWEDGGCPIHITLDLLWATPAQGNMQMWRMIGENLIACAMMQTNTEITSVMGLQGMEKHVKKHTALGRQLSRGEVRSVAKVGPGKARFDGELQARRERRAATGQIG